MHMVTALHTAPFVMQVCTAFTCNTKFTCTAHLLQSLPCLLDVCYNVFVHDTVYGRSAASQKGSKAATVMSHILMLKHKPS